LDELLVDGIRYEKLAGDYYTMSLFDQSELETYFDRAYQVKHAEEASMLIIVWLHRLLK
jgi:type III restriction enzyme